MNISFRNYIETYADYDDSGFYYDHLKLQSVDTQSDIIEISLQLPFLSKFLLRYLQKRHRAILRFQSYCHGLTQF